MLGIAGEVETGGGDAGLQAVRKTRRKKLAPHVVCLANHAAEKEEEKRLRILSSFVVWNDLREIFLVLIIGVAHAR